MEQKKYRIITDGSCDLPKELTKEKDIIVVPFYVSFDSENYLKEMEEISVRDFYNKMVEDPKTFPKSSMPSVQDYVDVFLPLVKEKTAIICICITTKFSGSLQSALGAKEIVLETYPDAEITVMDSTVDTVLQGLFVLEAVSMWEKNIPYEQTVAKLEEIKSSGRIFFTVGNMEYLKHGGRIGKLTGLAGSVLGIKPLITLKEGEIYPSGITRSRKKSMEKVLELLDEYMKEFQVDMKEYSITVGFGYDYEEACEFQKDLMKFMKERNQTVGEIPIFQIGATIGVHTGPYPLGLGIIKRHGL
ncbi:MAG: DegV family protein [Lachnospiraceae bacterium]|nr:DegV family protein [Lachnospiraceae bacterium]